MAGGDRLRSQLSDHALTLDLSWHGEHSAGLLIERLDGDVEALTAFFSNVVLHVLGNVVLVTGVLVVSTAIDWRAGLVLGVFAAVATAVMVLLRVAAVPAHDAEREANGQLYADLEERLGGPGSRGSIAASTPASRVLAASRGGGGDAAASRSLAPSSPTPTSSSWTRHRAGSTGDVRRRHPRRDRPAPGAGARSSPAGLAPVGSRGNGRGDRFHRPARHPSSSSRCQVRPVRPAPGCSSCSSPRRSATATSRSASSGCSRATSRSWPASLAGPVGSAPTTARRRCRWDASASGCRAHRRPRWWRLRSPTSATSRRGSRVVRCSARVRRGRSCADPKLLVVDDLSSALDVATASRLWDPLLDGGLRRALVVTHRSRVLARADRTIVLDRGRVVG